MYNAYPSVASTSLSASGTIAEEYYPLWCMSSTNGNTGGTSAGGYFVMKGNGSSTATISNATKLHTLNANWSPSQKFALEASISTGAGYTGYMAIYDFTTSTTVTASQISTTSSTNVLIRSGTFTLTPGHVIGLTVWGSANNEILYSKAHLVALEM